MEPPEGYGSHTKQQQVVHLAWWQVFLLIVNAICSLSCFRMSTGQTYDARLYSVCAPWNGERGDAYLRVFKNAFLAGLGAITDDYDSLRDHAEGKDTGGNHATAPAHPGGGAAAQSARAYRNRSNKVVALLTKHCTNVAVQRAIEAASTDYANAVAINGPLPYGAPAGSSMAQVALLVADSFGTAPNTGLSSLQRASRWESIMLRVVGYNPESMVQLKSLIDQTNSERPTADRFNDDACRIKFLSLIDSPTALADKAVA